MPIKKESILYIDDDSINLSLFEVSLGQEFNVITLSSTSEAIDILRNNEVKVIVSDQRMPNENGTDFFKRITPEYPDVIKILLTAFTDYSTAVNAINEAGIYKYLQKPWNTGILIDTIKTAIREFDLHMENKELLKQLKFKNEDLEEAYTKIETAYNKLKESENKFFTIFSKSNDSMYILNPNKEIVDANLALCKLLGHNDMPCDAKTMTEFINQHYPVLLNKPVELSHNTDKSIYDFELDNILGEHKFIEMNCNSILVDDNVYILSVLRDITERRLFENKIVEVIIKTQEEVQGKYAKELHDGLGPLLSSLKMNIEMLASHNSAVNKEKIIDFSIRAIKDSIKSVKEIANNLSPHILQRFGLVNAVRSYIDQIKESSGIEFIVNSNLKEKIPENIELILYRVILECINNSIKHAFSSKIEIRFHKEFSNLTINYADNGKGFDIDKILREGRGMGIFNIQNRIKNIGGEFHIFSNPDIGTNINITIKI